MKTIVRFLIAVLFMILLYNSLRAQVVIKPETARYFLEADDERFLLREKDSASTVIIRGLEEEVSLKLQAINHFRANEIIAAAEYNVLVDEIDSLNQDISVVEVALVNSQTLNYVFVGAATGAVIGSAIGQPIIGALIGAGVGYVVRILKRRKNAAEYVPNGV